MSISSAQPIRFSDIATLLNISYPVSVTKIVAKIPGATLPFSLSYVYDKPLGGPQLSGISPTYGFTNGGGILNVIGSGFTGSEAITIGGTSVTGVTKISDTLLQCTIPTNTTGTKDVVLTGGNTLSAVFTYYTPASSKSKYRSFSSTTVPSGSATYFHDVTWSSDLGMYAAVAQFSASTDGIITSSDGSTWTRMTSPFRSTNDTYLRVIASTTSRFMTSGVVTNQTAFSSNGTTWTQSTGVTGRHSAAWSPTLDVWIIPGPNIIYYSNNNGSSWSSTSVTVNPLGCIWAGAPFNKFFVFPRTNGNILYSSDGSSWSSISPGIDSGNYYYAAGYSSDLQQLMTIANNGGAVYTSTNGTTWTLVGYCNMLDQVRSLLWNADMNAWFASGKTGVAVSEDGVNWLKITNITTDLDVYADYTSKGIAYSNSLDKFVTAHATMYVSDTATKGSILFGTDCYLTYTNSTDFQFGTSDFTIEFWSYQTTINENTQYVMSYGTSFAVMITTDKKLDIKLGGTNVYSQTLPNYYQNVWLHIAISRSGSTLRVFVNGTQLGSNVSNSTNITDASAVLCIGNQSTPVSANSFLGNLTGIHIMKGYAKYTANFNRIAHEIVGSNTYSKLLLTGNSTSFTKDFSSVDRSVSNTSCTSSNLNPFR